MDDTRKAIEQYLQTADSNEDLIIKLKQINRSALYEHADMWAKALLAKNPEDFLDIYKIGLHNHQNKDLIIEILDAIEIHEYPHFADLLFDKLRDPKIINRKFRNLAESDLPDDVFLNIFRLTFLQRNNLQSKAYLSFDDETAFLLYTRLPDTMYNLLQRSLKYSKNNHQGYPKTLQAIEDKHGRNNHFYQIYRNVANEEQYHQVLREIIENPPESNNRYRLWGYRPKSLPAI